MLEKGFIDAIQKIATERGKDIFLEPKKLKSFLLDYSKNEFKKENSLLLTILEAECVKYIKMAENLVDCKQFLVKRLEDDYSLSPSKSAEMLDLLVLVLRGEKIETLKTEYTDSQLSKNTMLKDNGVSSWKPLHAFVEEKEGCKYKYGVPLAISPNGKFIILSKRGDRALKLWDAEILQLARTIETHDDNANCVNFSPDNKFIVSASDKTLKLWKVDTGQLIRTFEGHNGAVGDVAFSPDGKFIISGSSDKTLKLWEADTGELIRTFKGHKKYANFGMFSPNGKLMLSSSYDSNFRLWETDTGKLIHTFDRGCYNFDFIAFSPDNKILVYATYGGNLKFWETSTRQFIRTLGKEEGGPITFSPNGEFILSVSYDDELNLWGADTGRLIRTFNGHYSMVVRTVAFSPNGECIASGADDGIFKLWETDTGKLIRIFEDPDENVSRVNGFRFSPNNNYIITWAVSVSDNIIVKLWGCR